MTHWLPAAWRRLRRPDGAATGNARWRVFAASCALLGLLAHLGLLPWFLWRGIPELVWYSLLTLPVYLLALWVFSSIALLTDGIGLWLKPNADWLITWLPVALSMVLAARRPASDGVSLQASKGI